MSVLEAVDLAKSFRGGDGGQITVLEGLSMSVERGEIVAIVGASGAGKSTLLHLLGGLDYPDRGSVRVNDEELIAAPPASLSGNGTKPRRSMDARERARDDALSVHRNRTVGFVFQFHHLLREFSALENVMMPLRIAGVPIATAETTARQLLERVGLSGRMHHRPAELSGGEQQRAAVARALAASPSLLLADEPSGNLDHSNSERLHSLLVEVAHDFHTAMVIVTHNRSLARRAARTLLLQDGVLRAASSAEAVS
jgi:lipoprotein-releasing system ATP-binding protein